MSKKIELWFKNFLSNETKEIKENRSRVLMLVFCSAILIIFVVLDQDSDNEEIILEDRKSVEDFSTENILNETDFNGVKIVLGANSEEIFIGDPFENKKTQPAKISDKSLPVIPTVPFKIPSNKIPAESESCDKIFLKGTAISGKNKLAMFIRNKDTLFLTINEEINGRKIIDITQDTVKFETGEVLEIQKELR